MKECPQGVWEGGTEVVERGGATWSVTWALSANFSNNGAWRGRFYAQEAMPADRLENDSTVWVSPRMEATCWDEVWYNTVTGGTYYYTSYTGRVLTGTVYGKGEDEETTCLYDLGCDDDDDGGDGGEGGGGHNGGQLWQTCVYTVYSDSYTGEELWRTVDYCYVHY